MSKNDEEREKGRRIMENIKNQNEKVRLEALAA